MFSLAIQAGKLVHKPHFPMLRENNVRAGFFEREQYLAVQKHLPASMQPVVTFAYVTGWRINSASGASSPTSRASSSIESVG